MSDEPSGDEIDRWWRSLFQPLPEYEIVVEKLKPILFGHPGKIIGIDGRPGVGKTSLARYLGWKFSLSVLETDLFAKDAGKDYHWSEIKRFTDARISKSSPRPIIIDGVTLLQILEDSELSADYLIYWNNVHTSARKVSSSDILDRCIAEYEKRYDPRQSAQLVVNASIDIFAALNARLVD